MAYVRKTRHWQDSQPLIARVGCSYKALLFTPLFFASGRIGLLSSGFCCVSRTAPTVAAFFLLPGMLEVGVAAAVTAASSDLLRTAVVQHARNAIQCAIYMPAVNCMCSRHKAAPGAQHTCKRSRCFASEHRASGGCQTSEGQALVTPAWGGWVRLIALSHWPILSSFRPD